HHRAVGIADEPADFLGSVGDAAVNLADAEYDMARARFARGPAHLTRRMQLDGDRAGDRAQGLAPADDAGDRLLVHAILQRDDISARGQVLLDHRRRPGGVVGLHADEGDVDWCLFAELLRLGQMQRARLDRERLDNADMGDPQAVLADGVDVFRPRIDIGHVLAGLHHMGTGITANRPCTDDRYFLLRHHVFSRLRFAARLAARSVPDPSTADIPRHPIGSAPRVFVAARGGAWWAPYAACAVCRGAPMGA